MESDAIDYTIGYENNDLDIRRSTSVPYDNKETKTIKEIHFQEPVVDVPTTGTAGEFLYQMLILFVGFAIPYLFYYIKLLLKKLKWGSERVFKVLDKLEKVSVKSLLKVGNKYINKKFKSNADRNGYEATNIVADSMKESLRGSLYVDPNNTVKKEEPPIENYDASIGYEETMNTNVNYPKYDTEIDKCKDCPYKNNSNNDSIFDLTNPHHIILKNLNSRS